MQYTIYDVCDLALAMSIAEFGADPREIVLDVPSGTFLEKKKKIWSFQRPTFVYVPYFFSGLRSEMDFYDFDEAFDLVRRRPRAAIVSVDHIIDHLDAAFTAPIISFNSPFSEEE